MSLVVLAGILVVAAGLAGAAALAIRARRDYRAGNEVIPGRPTAAPAEWAGAHTPEARLHRRLVDVVASLRAHPLLEEGTGRLEARVELEEQVAAVDERLIAAAALPERVRDEPLALVEEEVAAMEQAAADLVAGTGPAALEPPASAPDPALAPTESPDLEPAPDADADASVRGVPTTDPGIPAPPTQSSLPGADL
ncbi:MAG: hypothetical protein JNK12_03710 [Acidimicrobiales bacterium]|nr:hypothetical protein [Acidimicrobiales bacterium]